MKKNIVGLLGLATLLLGYGTVSAQSIPTLGSAMATTTIAQPYQQSQCVEPDGTVVYENRQFYFGDTYTTTDVVPKWGNGYDTLLLSATKVLVYNSSLFNFTSPIQWKSNGIPSNATVNTAVVSQGTFVVNSTSPGQLVYNIHRTALENAGSSSYSLTYLGRPNLVGYTAQLSNKTFHNQAGRVVSGYECVNYTVHYCGDGIVDTKQSIAGLPGGFANSIANEQCDKTAGVPTGYFCTSSCKLQQTTPTPTCSLTTTTPTINSGENALLSASYTNASLATLTPTILGLNFLYPNRSNNNIIVKPITTTTYILNTLGVAGLPGATCSVTVNVKKTSVTLSKTVINDILYRSGDLVSFRIDFANQGVSTVNNVVLTDNLPGGLDYASSQIFGVSAYTIGTGTNGGTQFLQYSGFNLVPGQAGYFIVTGKFKGYAYASQNMNHVYLSANNIATLYANAQFHTYVPSANATITKTVDKVSYTPGEDVKFAITVTNNGPDTIDNVQIIDTWPNSSCIVADIKWTAAGSVPMTMINNGAQPYTWNLDTSLPVGQSVYLYLLGHITNSASCIGTYTNVVNLRYTVNGQLKTGQANVTFNVAAIPTASMTIKKSVLSYGNNVGDPVVFELIYTNNSTTTISSYDIVDYWPGTLNFVSATPTINSQTPNVGGSLLRWIFTTPIAPNGSGKIIINGTIK